MFCISIGQDTKANGLCCIALGDNQVVSGAFRVQISDKFSVPQTMTRSKAVIVLKEIDNIKAVYDSFVEQKLAPLEFKDSSQKAIKMIKDSIKKKFGKSTKILIEEVEKEFGALQKQKEDYEKEFKELQSQKDVIEKKMQEVKQKFDDAVKKQNEI